VIVAFCVAISPTKIGYQLEDATMDWRLQARRGSDPPPDPRIAMIGIGDLSLREIGRWEEWTRDIHARFVTALASRPPRVLVFDFFFSESSRNEEHDLVFSDALALYPDAITGFLIDPTTVRRMPDKEPYFGKTMPISQVEGKRSSLLGGEEAVVPIPLIAESAWTGTVDFPRSSYDGMGRVIPLVCRVRDKVYPSLVLQIIMRMEECGPDQVRVILGDAVYVPRKGGGERKIPINRSGAMELNYRDTQRLEIVDYYAVYSALAALEAGTPWPEGMPPLEGQIVLIGQSAGGLSDLGPTPYSSTDPLFRVQATALNSILQEDYLSKPRAIWFWGGWLLVAWATLFGLYRAPVAIAFAVPVVMLFGYGITAFELFESSSFLLPMALPMIGFALVQANFLGTRLLAETREKRYLRSVFSTYVSPEVVNNIVASGVAPKLGGERVEITAFFSDIQDFSTFSELLVPETLVELMVEYLSEMTHFILQGQGTLDKYIGDAIVAMFGAPIPLRNHAYAAVAAAIKIQQRQLELQELWKERPEYPDVVHRMRTRIGLNTGDAVVGNMGSPRRFNYTMMGDTVNIAARCESGAKSYGVFTMITGETMAAAKTSLDDVCYRPLDRIVVKGRSTPVEIVEVVGYKKDVGDEISEGLDYYGIGLKHYYEGDWEFAAQSFERAARRERYRPGETPGVKINPSVLMADRCRGLLESPPTEAWTGVYQMTEK
jgi:adenylate cyclase